jgi:hypothetical protein
LPHWRDPSGASLLRRGGVARIHARQKELAVAAVDSAEREVTGDDRSRKTAIEQARAFFGDTWDDIYGFAPREPNHAWLHDPDVPAAVIAADDAEAVRWPRQSYVEALLAGHSARFAAEVDCNVFVGSAITTSRRSLTTTSPTTRAAVT